MFVTKVNHSTSYILEIMGENQNLAFLAIVKSPHLLMIMASYHVQKPQKSQCPSMPINAHAHFTIFWVGNGQWGWPPPLLFRNSAVLIYTRFDYTSFHV